jgi:azurin
MLAGAGLASAQAAKTGAAKTPATAAASAAGAKVCKLEITGNDLIQYDRKELRIAADCATVQLTLKHAGKLPAQSMGHNWVLTKTADAAAVATAALKAGPANNHVPPGDKRVIAHTRSIGGGQSDTVTFPVSALQKGGDYTYQCTFPGHAALMRGKLIVG